MKNPKKISIPNPCSESWDAMRTNDSGRFCNACEKTVIDFTKMSDEDFVAYFQHIKTASCGRFSERQLDINIPIKSSPLLPFWKMSKYVAASMIAAAGLSGKVFGQKVEMVQAPVDQVKLNKGEKEQIKEQEIIVAGIVIDKHHDAVIGAIVSVQNSDINTMTDIDGNFKLSVPKSLIKNGYCYLKVLCIGFKESYQAVNLDYHYYPISLVLDNSTMLMGDVRITKVTKWMQIKWWFRDNFL